MDKINEGTTGYLTVVFKDKDGSPEAPASATYRIDCLTNNQEIRADTAIDPIAASVEIELTSTDNAIIDANNILEKRLVTVKGSYGIDDKVNEKYEYAVLNLLKI